MPVPESIATLRQICQAGPNWQVHQPWAFRQIRRVSIFFTWLLLHTPVTPNGVTLLGVAAGIGTGILLGMEHFVGGAVLLQVAIVLDFCDGEVSRYRRAQSKQGSYLDKVYHFTVQPAIFAGLTIGAHQQRPSVRVLVAGLIATIGVAACVMVMGYANELAVWKHARKLVDKLSAALAGPDGLTAALAMLPPLPAPVDGAAGGAANGPAGGPPGDGPRSFAQRVADMSGLWDFPYIFLVVTAGSLLQAVRPHLELGSLSITPVEIVLWFYALTYPAWMGLFLVHVLTSRATERGYTAFAQDLHRLLERRAAHARVPDGVDARVQNPEPRR